MRSLVKGWIVLVILTFVTIPIYLKATQNIVIHVTWGEENEEPYLDERSQTIPIIEDFEETEVNEIPWDEGQSRNYRVNYPTTLRKCSAAHFALVPEDTVTIKDLEDDRMKYHLHISCTASEHPEDYENTAFDFSFSRSIPFLVDVEKKRLEAIFFPDDLTEQCNIFVEGLENDPVNFSVEELTAQMMTESCWHCTALLHHTEPLPSQFILMQSNGNKLWNSRTPIAISQKESLELYIVPLPENVKQFEAVSTAGFNAWLQNEESKVNVLISREFETITKGEKGYKLIIEGSTDPGIYQLVIALYWYYSSGEPYSADKPPVLFGSHPFHEYSVCDLYRSEIYGSRLNITIFGENLLDNIDSLEKCTKVNLPGRWLSLDIDKKCEIPYCTGDRLKALVTDYSWQGAKLPWVWVPYNCYYHFYTPQEIASCAKELNISWIHIMGDSIAREFVGYLMSVFEVPDTTKFDHADVLVANDTLRITFLTWHDLLYSPSDAPTIRNEELVIKVLDHFNILGPDTSEPLIALGEIANDFELEKTETDRPDVFFMNPATAYSLFKQKSKDYAKFVDFFVEAMKNSESKFQDNPITYWYQGTQIFGTAHAGTEFITQTRHERFSDITKEKLKQSKIKYFDALDITQARFDESWDGLHYLSGYEEWRGHAASVNVQLWLNELFGSCKGTNN